MNQLDAALLLPDRPALRPEEEEYITRLAMLELFEECRGDRSWTRRLAELRAQVADEARQRCRHEAALTAGYIRKVLGSL